MHINRQTSITTGINICALSNLELIHCTEPPLYISWLNDVVTNTLIKNTMSAGYHLLVTKHSHIYLNIKILQLHRLSHQTSYDGRLQKLLSTERTYTYSRYYPVHLATRLHSDAQINNIHYKTSTSDYNFQLFTIDTPPSHSDTAQTSSSLHI